jgi:hypothetical protein
MAEKTQDAQLIAGTLKSLSNRLQPGPPAGTEMVTCIEDKTSERLANTKVRGAIVCWRYELVSQ